MIDNLDIRRASIGLYDEFSDVAALQAVPGKEDLNYENVRLVTLSGMPSEIGFMDGTNNPFEQDRYVLNSWPEHVKHLFHHLYITQYPGQSHLVVSEEDWGLYMEGIDNSPNIINRQEVTDNEVSLMAERLLVGSFILATEVATEFRDHLSNVGYEPNSIDKVRQFGLELIRADNVVEQIDSAMLERYALEA